MNQIIEAFRTLSMKVIWKVNPEGLSLSKNVLAEKWVPQNDVLAHKNVKLFITHGGNAGIQEGLYHKVPMIVIPVFGDQVKFRIYFIQPTLLKIYFSST